MKKIFLIFIISLFTLSSFLVTSAQTQPMPITMYFNDEFVSTEVEPFIQDGITYVPLRSFTDLFSIDDVVWNEDEKSVAIVYSNKVITFFLDQSKVLVNGREYEIEGQPTLVDGNTMVPLNFLTDNLEYDVTWDTLTNSLFMSKEGVDVVESVEGYTMDDVLWLARIIQVEGNGTSYDCRLAIANVVLNRVKSNVFPDSVYEVIYQPGQFPPTGKDGFAERIPAVENIYVAKKALNGENNVSNALYFNNRPFGSKANDLSKIIDGEYFYN